ncbi:hypothetical protein K1T71_001732 [Dendrolimus kikuchii]|uniref:Uncharacterized protein n=1 Tax=Dendrolimus kikuchii TaxID=765133 RepID=A0ACC1DEI2_9NEOP|nr:hypothetical protein K1T71_001732 [Dendrolimus kikuchii]
MVKFRRKTVTLSDFWISSSEKLSDFYALSWQHGDSAIPLLVLRGILASVAVGILIWSLVDASHAYWLIYLTNWAMALVAFMMTCALAVSCVAVSKKGFDTYTEELPWFVSMYWFVFNIAVTVALMVTTLYWILIYNPDSYWEDCTWSMFALDISSHAVVSVIALLELVLSRTPVLMLHIYQPLGVALWYVAFTAIYYAAGGTDGNGNPFIYEVLDWQQGKRAGMIASLGLIGVIIVYTILWGIALCRDKVSTAIFRSTSHNLPNAGRHANGV